MSEENKLILTDETQDIVDQVVKEKSIDKLKDLTTLFNVQIKKEEMLRRVKLSNLSNKIVEEIERRLDNRPGEFSNQDIIAYMNAVQNATEKSDKVISGMNDTPAISPIVNNTQVNVNIEDSLSREERERVLSALNGLLGGVSPDDYEDKTTQGE